MTNERANHFAKRIIFILLPLIILVAVGLWLANKPTALPMQGMAEADSIKVSAKVPARIKTLYVREGARVNKGDILFELDSPEVEAKYRQAEAVLAAATAQSAKAEEGARDEQIRAAKANYQRAQAASDLASSTAKRLDNLFAEGVVSRQRRDEAHAQAVNAEQMMFAAKAQLDEATAGAREQDKAAAKAQVKQAEAVLAEVDAAREELQGVAPASGEVSKRLADMGELVPAGFPVFMLEDTDNMWVSLYIREDDFSSINVEDKKEGYIPALDQRHTFSVYFIAPAGEFATWRATRQSAGYDVRSFEVRLKPERPIKGFRPGMSVLFDR